MTTFTIDFFELCFLAEACIPPRPIARAMFWQDLTRKYYKYMSPEERIKIFEYLNRNDIYRESLEFEEDTQIFHARFDPNNQYSIETRYENKDGIHDCFLWKGNYYINIDQYINQNSIIKITKL